MPALAYPPLMAIEDYLSEEQLSENRHEYVNGKVYSMEGASQNHNEIAGNICNALRSHCQSGSCRVFMSDVKVRLRSGLSETCYRPDVVVSCNPCDTDDKILRFPKLIIEVFSESTERLDRIEKFERYITIPMLEEYVLVAQDRVQVTIHRRRHNWAPEILESPEATLELESVGLSLPLNSLYENIKGIGLDQAEQPTESDPLLPLTD